MDLTGTVLEGLDDEVDALRAIGGQFYASGWSVGTSSNYSVVIGRDPLELLVTASGMDKGRLSRRDFVRVDADGRPNPADQPKSSAETLLHIRKQHTLPCGEAHTTSPYPGFVPPFRTGEA